MFVERITSLPETLGDFSPGWQANDRASWSSLDATYRKTLTETASKQPTMWPILPASAYLDFTRNGNRDRFEASYMQRRRMLNAFALAECADYEGKYLDHIVDGALLLCEESGWQLPAHNNYIRDTACLPLPDTSRPIIDLFAAETGAQLATLLHLFKDEFDAITPMISERITRELQNRIITPYLNSHFWWMGNGDEPMCNWTAWCTQNVLITAFLLPLNEDTKLAIIKQAAYSLDAFLKDYGDDGACEEGILYYRHAGLCLFNALNILTTVAPDAFSPLWQNRKIRNIAEFVAHMHIEGDRFFNFADSSAKADYCGARDYLFGKAIGSQLLEQFALFSWKQDPQPDLPQEINLFYRLQTAQTIGELANATSRPDIPDHHYPSIGLVTTRDDRYALAIKAGDNGDSHNHNDVGSVILYKNNQPFLIDVGVETYSAKTFSDRRYEIWTMQSGFHNLATFGDIEQIPGEQAKASDVKVQLSQTQTLMEMELATAYPKTELLRSYRRTVRFSKGKGIEIIDIYDCSLPTTLSLMFAQKPDISPTKLTLANLGTIALDGCSQPTLETIAIEDPRLRAAWPHELYRVLLPVAGSKLKLVIE